MGSSQSQPSGAPKSAATHTPGPWTVHSGTTTGQIVLALDQPKVRRTVAACGGQRRDANAALIAAAPELLAALQPFAAFEAIRSRLGGTTPHTGVIWGVETQEGTAEITAEDMRRAIAAITKANGQEVAASGDELAREGSVSGMNPEKGAAQ